MVKALTWRHQTCNLLFKIIWDQCSIFFSRAQFTTIWNSRKCANAILSNYLSQIS